VHVTDIPYPAPIVARIAAAEVRQLFASARDPARLRGRPVLAVWVQSLTGVEPRAQLHRAAGVPAAGRRLRVSAGAVAPDGQDAGRAGLAPGGPPGAGRAGDGRRRSRGAGRAAGRAGPATAGRRDERADRHLARVGRPLRRPRRCLVAARSPPRSRRSAAAGWPRWSSPARWCRRWAAPAPTHPPARRDRRANLRDHVPGSRYRGVRVHVRW